MITILKCRVKLLCFPKSHLPHVTYAIVKACFFQDTRDPHYFFSFTENAHEISIVASTEIIDNEFIPNLTMCQCYDLSTSEDVYRILQVDDEDSSGKQIVDLSGTLAEGKLSMLYMSTYQTDFVLIKETNINKAVQLVQQKYQIEFDADSTSECLSFEEPSNLFECDTVQDVEKSMLPDELYCVGLNPHYQSEWAMTVLKILSYPELISHKLNEVRFLSFTISSDGISLIANQQILDLFKQGTLFQDEQDQHAYRVIQVHCDLETCGIPLAVEAHIDNLLYLSTFKSMNILVPAEEAEDILENYTTDMITKEVIESSL